MHTRWRAPNIVSGVIAASVTVMLALVASWVWWPSFSAQAYTPAPLSYAATSGDVQDVIHAAKEMLASGKGVLEPQRLSLSEGWYFSGTPDTEGPVLITRERIDLRWEADLSGSVRTTVAAVTTPDGVLVPEATPAAGSLIGELTFAPAEFSVVSVNAPAATSDAMRAWIRADRGATGQLGAGDVILGVQSLLGQWTLTDRQQAALLDVLAQAPGARFLGTTHDRMGRPVMAISAVPESNAHQDVTLLLALDTGRIVGFESTLRTEDESLGLPAGSVTAYTLWEIEN